MNAYCLPVYKQLEPLRDPTDSVCPCHVSSSRPGLRVAFSRSECLFILTRLCWMGLMAWRGEKLQLVSFVQKLQQGSRSLPRVFQLRAGIYQHADLHIYHGSLCLAQGQVVENGEGGRGREKKEATNRAGRGFMSFAIYIESPPLKELVVLPVI